MTTMYDYQIEARKTAIYPVHLGLTYCALGLAGEAGEVAEKIKKHIRDETPLDELRAHLKKELGDVIWYVSNLAWEVDLSLSDIANSNLDKLRDRQERGVLKGSGDDR